MQVSLLPIICFIKEKEPNATLTSQVCFPLALVVGKLKLSFMFTALTASLSFQDQSYLYV